MENKRPRTSFFKRDSDAEGGTSVETPIERSEKPERAERSDRPERAPRSEKTDRSDRPERTDRPERAPRGDRDDRPRAPRRSDDRGERPARNFGDRGDRPERGERKPFDRDRKPYDGERKPFDRDRKPFGGERGERGGERKFGGDRKPFRRDDEQDRRRDQFYNDKKGVQYEEPAPLQAPENLIFGIHPVKEALEAGQPFEKIYVKKDTEAAEGIIDYADSHGIPVQYVPIEKLDKLTRRNNHQGVVAVIPAIEYADFNQVLEDVMAQEKPALFVVLDGITDVRNFGAIARTAECVGADAIIVGAKNAAPINSEAMKTSAGALASIPVCRVGSLRNTLKTMQLAGVQLVAATEKSTNLLYESTLTESVAIIMGSEESGVSVDVLRICDQKLAIPLLGKIESLNVSAAASVLLYEVVRQRFEQM